MGRQRFKSAGRIRKTLVLGGAEDFRISSLSDAVNG